MCSMLVSKTVLDFIAPTQYNTDSPPPSSWAGLDGFVSEGEGEEGGSISPIGLPQYRRHSTDTTHLNLCANAPPVAKTRSSDNISAASVSMLRGTMGPWGGIVYPLLGGEANGERGVNSSLQLSFPPA